MLRLNFLCNIHKLRIERVVANYCVIPVVIKIRYITRIYVIMIYIVDFIFCTIRQIGHVSRSLQNMRSHPTLMYYSALSVICVYFRVLYILSHAPLCTCTMKLFNSNFNSHLSTFAFYSTSILFMITFFKYSFSLKLLVIMFL